MRAGARTDGRIERLSAVMLQTRSDVLAACEQAVFKAEKVDRAQVLTGDRIDRLETRVKALETRRRRR